MRLHNSQPTAKCVTTNRIELQSVSYAGICRHVHSLRGLPSEGLQRHHKPGACGCTIPNRLQNVSQRIGLSCNLCHTQGFVGTSTACVACHLKDYNATTNPAHAAAQFPTDCKMCHNEVD